MWNLEELLELLEQDYQLRRFVVGFYNRLAENNPNREVSIELTQEQFIMDSLGRLLVGDEICAAIAIDGTKIFVSSNLDGHSKSSVTIYIKRNLYEVDETGCYINIRAVIQCDFLSSNGDKHPVCDENGIYYGKYQYYKQEKKLKLMGDNRTIHYEVPYSLHCIDEYPVPFGCALMLKDEIDLQETNLPDLIKPNATITPPLPVLYSMFQRLRLDPLFRRAATVFSHLGSICLVMEKIKAETVSPLYVQAIFFEIENKRKYVMQQTLLLEIANLYKLSKVIHELSDDRLSSKERKIREEKRNQIKNIEIFISEVIESLNEFLNAHLRDLLSRKSELIEITVLIDNWREKLQSDIKLGNISIPKIIAGEKLIQFLDTTSTYIYTLLYLEQYILRQCNEHPNLLTYTLARIAEHEIAGRDTDGLIKIIDVTLAKGTHAEIRLFYYMMILQKKSIEEMPYFGITQLCCASCNLLFKSYQLNYMQGSANRAGTHGKQYFNWLFDEKLRTNDLLKKFFGKRLFSYYINLTGQVILSGNIYERRKIIFDIIQNLAILYPETAPQKNKMQALGFEINPNLNSNLNKASNYPDIKKTIVISDKAEVLKNYICLKHFCEHLKINFGLKINYAYLIKKTIFDAVINALILIRPHQYSEIIRLGSQNAPLETHFTFWRKKDKKKLAAHIVEEMTLKYIDEYREGFSKYLEDQKLKLQNAQELHIPANQLILMAIASKYDCTIILLILPLDEKTVPIHVIKPTYKDLQSGIDIHDTIILVYDGKDYFEANLFSESHEANDNFMAWVKQTTGLNASIEPVIKKVTAQGSSRSSSFFDPELTEKEMELRDEGSRLINIIWGNELKSELEQERKKLKSKRGQELDTHVQNLRKCLPDKKSNSLCPK